jgi:hypothetical protein
LRLPVKISQGAENKARVPHAPFWRRKRTNALLGRRAKYQIKIQRWGQGQGEGQEGREPREPRKGEGNPGRGTQGKGRVGPGNPGEGNPGREPKGKGTQGKGLRPKGAKGNRQKTKKYQIPQTWHKIPNSACVSCHKTWNQIKKSTLLFGVGPEWIRVTPP